MSSDYSDMGSVYLIQNSQILLSNNFPGCYTVMSLRNLATATGKRRLKQHERYVVH